MDQKRGLLQLRRPRRLLIRLIPLQCCQFPRFSLILCLNGSSSFDLSPLSEWNTFRFVLHFTLTSFIVTATLPPPGLLQQLFHLPDSVFPSVASYRMPRRCEYAYPLIFLNTLILNPQFVSVQSNSELSLSASSPILIPSSHFYLSSIVIFLRRALAFIYLLSLSWGGGPNPYINEVSCGISSSLISGKQAFLRQALLSLLNSNSGKTG
ncbi:hypothetical protein BT69DRAFT_885464 [Atractiella rhizophila]|nr:hypothetical protein BT69DRAFT_885464 [Atractiella rhizophila]